LKGNLQSNHFFDISPEVREALETEKPVIALESAIITHGMPFPENLKTAITAENIIRENGVIPATIAVIDGKIKVGLTGEELEKLSSLKNTIKISRRDLPLVITKIFTGGTTVAGTMVIAKMAKIPLFVTGGIGGVHREAKSTMDISADLEELACTDVTVVCAGVKSILDIGATIEYLETHGVPVIGYKTDRFPGFYTRDSGFSVDYKIDTPEEAAMIIYNKLKLGLKGGVVIANPIPEKYAISNDYMNRCIDEAIVEMKKKKITGKGVTPFLLAKIEEITGGKSLESNIELVKNNAMVGASIALEYANLIKRDV